MAENHAFTLYKFETNRSHRSKLPRQRTLHIERLHLQMKQPRHKQDQQIIFPPLYIITYNNISFTLNRPAHNRKVTSPVNN